MAKEIKNQNTIYLNIKHKKEEQKEKIAKWCENQSNKTNSILSLIEHAIDRFGNEDVMNHEIARKLYMERLYFDEKDRAYSLFPIQKENENESETKNRRITMTEQEETEKKQASKPENEIDINDNQPTEETFGGFDPRAF
ncbi:hypothetical protein G3M81_23070 [Bacillus paralicheniformis]|jgi:hypothetical protein|uniref:hypothetical protein n=1 Tax=Bacillus TaxID=1386 RepID=UPI0013EE5BF0|nr:MULTISPECIES: hypothetical protein [Bacillus]QII26974.1 hypothetical protein G3M80_20980 [Bacillus altitudinis]QII51442.1 hypothetical protein G3M81_23070 [Bacillus paralicheniformis]